MLDWCNSLVDVYAATITIDFKDGIGQAVQHLVSLGHSRVAHVSGRLDLWTSQVRKGAFRESLSTYGLNPEEALIVESNLRIDGGF